MKSSSYVDELLGWEAPGSIHEGTHYWMRHPVDPDTQHEANNSDTNEVIVCVHGIGSYHNTFNRFADNFLSRGYSVLVFDLIGRGFSEPSGSGRYGRDEHLHQMVNLLTFLGLMKTPKSFHLVGHSMGGSLATLFTSAHSDYVKSLTLIAPAGLLCYFPLEFLKTFCGCFQGVLRQWLTTRSNAVQAWRNDFVAHEGPSLQLEDEWVSELSRMYDNNDHAHNALWQSLLEFPLSQIHDDVAIVARKKDLPIFILWGKKDVTVPFSNLTEWKCIIDRYRCNDCSTFFVETFEQGAHGILSEFHKEVHFHIAQFLSTVK
jgi:pimeloyl-ACP methyl ester carboxylesterase